MRASSSRVKLVKELSETQNIFVNVKKKKIMESDQAKQYLDIKINIENREVKNAFQYLAIMSKFTKKSK